MRGHGIPKLAGILALFTSFATISQAQPEEGVSGTRVKAIRSAPVSNAGDICMSFEAEFSGPVKGDPKAVADIEQFHRLDGIISKVLEAIRISPQRFRFLMKSSRDECSKLRLERPNVAVTVEGATGSDGLPVLPEQETFRPNSPAKSQGR